ncbi:hypothetical protein RHMOL_Rhmol06G0050100 [Rhododendron molle]|uniref:Uncharacterized protein n=2 Tax=Rhododendron molle TaxID=49168 RepID=A0ACC0NB63_RHOML|nr:hypothetical protein RHMOL_Rhmol06G0050100 [Rhododendron molle]KAI8549758.1 hypothetical protein RHMOL_Rhmol06G0050100 [Rhododendron molle]
MHEYMSKLRCPMLGVEVQAHSFAETKTLGKAVRRLMRQSVDSNYFCILSTCSSLPFHRNSCQYLCKRRIHVGIKDPISCASCVILCYDYCFVVFCKL